MDVLHFLRVRLKMERDELEQMVAGTLRIHRHSSNGELVDETDQSIQRVQQLIEHLEAQIRHLQRRQDEAPG
jgi:chromosome segregation ATPase